MLRKLDANPIAVVRSPHAFKNDHWTRWVFTFVDRWSLQAVHHLLL
jgi:hypothetical protein